MKKIGVLFGMENTFPGALVERINSMELEDVRAEFVQVGAVTMAEPSGYAVIVDRISHDMAFYRAYLKSAVLTGTRVINNPFWWSADDKFFNYSLATKLGVAVPRTVLLPHKLFPPEINQQSVRNLIFPLDWEAIFDYVKFPAFLKPHDGGGWRDVHHVHTADEFFRAYDSTRDLCMVLQAEVNFTEYFRCFVVGQQDVLVMPYDPRRPPAERYVLDAPECAQDLLDRMGKDALTLCRALGYDLNTVEFALEDGVPYAIDFMNPVPDADLHSLGKDSFEWIVDRVAKLAVKQARMVEPSGKEFHWSRFLAGEMAVSGKIAGKKASAPRSAPAKKDAAQSEAIVPAKKSVAKKRG
jgi:hypothetical protein